MYACSFFFTHACGWFAKYKCHDSDILVFIYIVRVLCRLLALVQHAHPHVLRIIEGEMRLIKLALVVGTLGYIKRPNPSIYMHPS